MFTSDNFPRISHKEFVILSMLAEQGEMYGLEMVVTSSGELKKGTIYVTLQRMLEKSFVEISDAAALDKSAVNDPRRRYKTTEFGEKVFRAHELALRYLNMNLGSIKTPFKLK